MAEGLLVITFGVAGWGGGSLPVTWVRLRGGHPGSQSVGSRAALISVFPTD